MHLYELAIELDKRSADLAEKAEALDLGPIIAASELTTEQVQALRAAFGRDPAPAAAGAVSSGTSLGPASEPRSLPAGKPHRNRTLLAIGALVLGVIAMIGFFLLKSEPNAERQKAIAADLQAWEDAPPATISPEAKAEAARTISPEEPVDKNALCAARKVMIEQEHRTAGSFDEFRAQAAHNDVWRTAVEDMARFGPAVARDEILAYRDTVAKYDKIIAGATNPELRAYLDGDPRGSLVDRRADVARVRKEMDAEVVPICGEPGG